MFILRAGDGDVGGLDFCVLELGLSLSEVGFAGDAAEEAVVGDAHGLGWYWATVSLRSFCWASAARSSK